MVTLTASRKKKTLLNVTKKTAPQEALKEENGKRRLWRSPWVSSARARAEEGQSSCVSVCAFALARVAGVTVQTWHAFSQGCGHVAGLRQEAFQPRRTLLFG